MAFLSQKATATEVPAADLGECRVRATAQPRIAGHR
jgi:hypothetical protein